MDITVKLEGKLPCACVVDALIEAPQIDGAAIVECPKCTATSTLIELVEWSMERAADAAADRAFARGVLTGGLLGAGVGFLFGLTPSKKEG